MKKHPAKYSNSLLPIFEHELAGYARIVDVMAGVGKIRRVRPDAYLNEIEWEWLALAPVGVGEAETVVGDALSLPWPDGFFDGVVTSPCYGNRMADHHNAKDGSKRNTYRHTLGRELSPNNAGAMQWGRAYRRFHWRAWQEVGRVLKPEGKFVLNVSDHIRRGRVMPVTRFHRLLLLRLGFGVEKEYQVATPRNGQGQNGAVRVAFESVLVLRKPLCAGG